MKDIVIQFRDEDGTMFGVPKSIVHNGKTYAVVDDDDPALTLKQIDELRCVTMSEYHVSTLRYDIIRLMDLQLITRDVVTKVCELTPKGKTYLNTVQRGSFKGRVIDALTHENRSFASDTAIHNYFKKVIDLITKMV